MVPKWNRQVEKISCALAAPPAPPVPTVPPLPVAPPDAPPPRASGAPASVRPGEPPLPLRPAVPAAPPAPALPPAPVVILAPPAPSVVPPVPRPGCPASGDEPVLPPCAGSIAPTCALQPHTPIATVITPVAAIRRAAAKREFMCMTKVRADDMRSHFPRGRRMRAQQSRETRPRGSVPSRRDPYRRAIQILPASRTETVAARVQKIRFSVVVASYRKNGSRCNSKWLKNRHELHNVARHSVQTCVYDRWHAHLRRALRTAASMMLPRHTDTIVDAVVWSLRRRVLNAMHTTPGSIVGPVSGISSNERPLKRAAALAIGTRFLSRRPQSESAKRV